MTMIVAIDAMAKRYSLLPSEVLDRASTFDLVVMDAALGYENYQHDKANGKKPEPKLSQETMLKMLNRVRQQDANNNQPA
jgi:hypothetical protein